MHNELTRVMQRAQYIQQERNATASKTQPHGWTHINLSTTSVGPRFGRRLVPKVGPLIVHDGLKVPRDRRGSHIYLKLFVKFVKNNYSYRMHAANTYYNESIKFKLRGPDVFCYL